MQYYLSSESIQPNLCDSDLHAIDHANSKQSRGYSATGVGGVLCGRHGLVRKNGLGNLQKGERYELYFFKQCSMLCYHSPSLQLRKHGFYLVLQPHVDDASLYCFFLRHCMPVVA